MTILLVILFHSLIRKGVLSLAVSSRGVAIVHLHTHPDGGVFAARALFGAELIALSPSLSSLREGGYIHTGQA